MAKLNIDLGLDDIQPEKDQVIEQQATALRDLTDGLPSVSQARNEGIRHAKRTQMNFSNVPLPIKHAFEQAAIDANMGMKEFFYHCLRSGGVDIPSYDALDGRRR